MVTLLQTDRVEVRAADTVVEAVNRTQVVLVGSHGEEPGAFELELGQGALHPLPLFFRHGVEVHAGGGVEEAIGGSWRETGSARLGVDGRRLGERRILEHTCLVSRKVRLELCGGRRLSLC